MFTFAEFQIQGHVGKITPVGRALRISIAATERWTDRETGEVREKTRWNTVTLWDNARGFDWIRTNLATGDLVHCRGDVEQASYDKDGQTVYTVDLRAEALSVIPTGRRDG
jgi:single-strand DNA-binding protein